MGKKACEHFRASLAQELQTIASILEAEGICPDAGPLKSAANQCRKGGGLTWHYDFSNVILRLSPTDKSFPRPLKNLSCRLNARIGGRCDVKHTQDPFTEISINISIEGVSEPDGKKHIQAWHFDRHISSSSDNSPASAHPRYHFQFGGRAMESYAEQFGIPCFDPVLLLDSPRIAHAPLDGILLIDFLLSNFVGDKWRSLRSKRNYCTTVAASQKRNWRPFVLALNCWASSSASHEWTPLDVWPHICD